ncbi:MAG TPA: tripartite tricarboxylate transporter substrate-binding protein [Burkholderiales bacterium]|nr:tripartite tricarboxylate transporter substrate-binding protein [Burkholderiales bacterium]
MRLIASTSPGSQPDGISRMLGQRLSEAWGKPVVIDNRNGAGGTLAAAMVAKATPDGHTLLYSLPSFTISAVLQPTLPYDPKKDFAGISQVGFSTNLFVVHPSLQVKSVRELIALAKAHPGKLIFGSGATGTAGHLSGARFNHVAGIKVVHVAFKGGPEAAIEVLAGRSSYTVSTMGVALPFVKEGKLVALAVTSPQRAPVLPEVPALGEIMPEFKRPETSHAVLAPAGTLRAVINAINRDIAKALEQHDIKERLQGIAFVTAPTTPDECDRILRSQIETLAGVVRDAGLKPR